MFSDTKGDVWLMFILTVYVLCAVFSALKKLDDLNKSLADYCAQKPPNGFKAEVGRPCCACFAGELDVESVPVSHSDLVLVRVCLLPVFKHVFMTKIRGTALMPSS